MVVCIVVLVLVCCAPLHQASAYYSDEDNDSLEDQDSFEDGPGYGRTFYNTGRNYPQHAPTYGRTSYNSGRNIPQIAPAYGPTNYNSGPNYPQNNGFQKHATGVVDTGCWGKRLSQAFAGPQVQAIGHRRAKRARASLASHTTVRHQGQYNNCWAFSVMATIERNIYKKYSDTVKLSEQFVIDCCPDQCQYTITVKTTTGTQVVSDGGMRWEALDFLQSNWLVELKDYPYVGPVGQCNTATPRLPYRIENIKEILLSDEAELVNELDRNPGYFMAIGIWVNDAFEESIKRNRHGIVDQTLCNEIGDTNHAVALAGYGTDASGTKYWEIRNSGGDGYGDEGYVKILRTGTNTCNYDAFAQVVTVIR